jgi:hypothetical protein
MSSQSLKIRNHKLCPAPGGTVPLYLLNFPTSDFVTEAKHGILGIHPVTVCDMQNSADARATSCSVWIPGVVLKLAIPDAFNNYVCHNGSPNGGPHPAPVCFASSHQLGLTSQSGVIHYLY